jgi:hypothetical protein
MALLMRRAKQEEATSDEYFDRSKIGQHPRAFVEKDRGW